MVLTLGRLGLETIADLEAMPRASLALRFGSAPGQRLDQAFGRLAEPRSEEHTSELQSLMRISYAVFCLKKKKIMTSNRHAHQGYQRQMINDKRASNKNTH